MLISAINKLTLVDYPGKLAAIIFTAGCNMRCGYCHNAEFVLPERIEKLKDHFIPFEAVKNFLQSRKGLLDAVVFCGGEPTMQSDLLERMEEVKAMGFLVKLDTNGLRPDIIKTALEKGIVDYIAMDLKTSLKQYPDLVRMPVDRQKIEESIDLVMHSGIEYEFRSTILSDHHDRETLEDMGKLIQGAKTWAIQNFRNKSVLDPAFKEKTGFTPRQMDEIKAFLKPFVKKLEVRG